MAFLERLYMRLIRDVASLSARAGFRMAFRLMSKGSVGTLLDTIIQCGYLSVVHIVLFVRWARITTQAQTSKLNNNHVFCKVPPFPSKTELL